MSKLWALFQIGNFHRHFLDHQHLPRGHIHSASSLHQNLAYPRYFLFSVPDGYILICPLFCSRNLSLPITMKTKFVQKQKFYSNSQIALLLQIIVIKLLKVCYLNFRFVIAPNCYFFGQFLKVMTYAYEFIFYIFVFIIKKS